MLQVPVLPLEQFVRARTAHYDPRFVSSDPAFVHAHVTALGPFVRPEQLDRRTVQALTEISRATEPFDFRLDEVATFPDGIIHLVPEPGAPFRQLTRRLVEVFPEFPPYAGAFAQVRPHLTLDAVSPEVSASSTRRLLGRLLPVACRAERLDLAWWESGGCRVITSWPLGG